MKGFKNLKKISILLISFIIFLSFSGCWDIPKYSEEDLAKIHSNMEQYLKNTYQKDFIVKKPKVTGNEGFGYNLYQAVATPIDNHKVEFTIAWDKRDPNKYEDTYLNKLWTYQGKDEVGQLLKKVYGYEVPFEYYFFYNYERLDVEKNNLKKLNYKDIIEKHSNDIKCTIICYFFTNKDVDKKAESEKAYMFYKQYILNNKINDYFITNTYLVEELRNEFLTKLNNGTLNFNPNELYRENKLINSLRMNYKQNNNSSEDILKRFDY